MRFKIFIIVMKWAFKGWEFKFDIDSQYGKDYVKEIKITAKNPDYANDLNEVVGDAE